MKKDPYHGAVYDTLSDEEWGRKKKKAKPTKIGKGGALVLAKKGKIVEMQKEESRALWLPQKDISHEPKPKKASWWKRRFNKKTRERQREGKIRFWKESKTISKRTAKGGIGIAKGAAHAISGTGEAAGRFGHRLPGPLSVFTLAWQKMTKALKTLIVGVFALALLFVPYGVFYYTGWAIGAAFMFLVSVIFWVFVSLFNSIAYAIVAIINGVTTIFMSAVIFLVESILGMLPGDAMLWDNGRELMNNALIKYGQVANIPSLYHIVEPDWQSWMNNTIIGQVIGWFGFKWDLSWLVAPFHDLYTGLDAGQAVVLGCIIIGIPIIFLAVVYYKNRHHLR